MKTIIHILGGLCILLLMAACENDTAATPRAAMTVSNDRLAVNESMTIRFTGDADQVVVYTGDDMHDYALREQSHTGFVVNKGLFTYSYTVPGTYKIVCVASTYTDRATDLKRDTCSYTVTVIDDQTEITKLSCPQILYDEVFAERMPNDEWLMRLPRKVKYNNQTPTIALSQRLRFYIGSDSTKVFVDGKAHLETNKYNLANAIDIRVQSNFGTVRPYKLYTLNYPEFATFKLAGVSGTLQRNEFDYSSFDLELSLPTGTDVSRLAPEFTTTSANEKVYLGETEQLSGVSVANFTGEVTYRLVATLPGHPDMKAEALVKVKITFR